MGCEAIHTPDCIMHKHMLVDGRNLVYRAIFAGRGDHSFMASGIDIFAVFARFIHYYRNEFRPDSIHIFWDDESKNLWRTKLLPTYKGQRVDGDNVKRDVYRIIKVSLATYKTLGIRQYFRYGQEADDLIYAFTKVTNESLTIISSDGDLKQIDASHTSIYDPSRKSFTTVKIDPRFKALVGDKSDNISGYYKVGPKTANILIEDEKKLKEFLLSDKSLDENKTVVHNGLYDKNLKLVDLSLNPHLNENIEYVSSRFKSPIQYDYNLSLETLKKQNVKGMMREAYKLFNSFSTLS